MTESNFCVSLREDGELRVSAALNHANEVPALLRAIEAAARILPSDDPEFEAFITTLRSDGLRINAVKRLRDMVRCGLKEAVQCVDSLRSGQFTTPTNRADLAAFVKSL